MGKLRYIPATQPARKKGKRSDGYVASGTVRYGTVDEDLVLENEIIRET